VLGDPERFEAELLGLTRDRARIAGLLGQKHRDADFHFETSARTDYTAKLTNRRTENRPARDYFRFIA